MAFKDVIKDRRKRKNLTQQQMATRLGIKVKAYAKYEEGRAMPRSSLLPIMATTLGLTLEQLLNPSNENTDSSSSVPGA